MKINRRPLSLYTERHGWTRVLCLVRVNNQWSDREIAMERDGESEKERERERHTGTTEVQSMST